jgi:anthranilate 1,2-dioxygenase large subunit
MSTHQVSPVVWPTRFSQIPKEVFVRPDVFEAEHERILYGPEWHPVAHAAEIPNKGDFKTFVLGKVPLLINRDRDGEIHVFFNTCTHRGTQLEMAVRGNSLTFSCPYHRWSFSEKGELKSCPRKAQGYSPGFSYDKYPLKRPRMAIFEGLIFVSLSEETPDLDSYLGDVKQTLREIMGGDGRLKLIGYQKARYDVNWKGYNDSDSYHAALLHGAFRWMNWEGGQGTQIVDRQRGHIGTSSQMSPPADKGASLLKDASLLEFKATDPSEGSRVIKLFPLFVAVKHFDVINLRFANPISVGQTDVQYAYFAHEDDSPEMVQHRIRQASNLLGPCGFITMEDAAVFSRIQIGSQAPGCAEFQKGVTDALPVDMNFKQNDESSQLLRWDYYRRTMGFQQEGA